MAYTWNTTTDLYRDEVGKCAPENHQHLMMGSGTVDDTTQLGATVWCPWAWARTGITTTYAGLPTCNGCMRPIDVVALGYLPTQPLASKSDRAQKAFRAAAGKHSIDAARSTEFMIRTARLAGITLAHGDIALVRQFFANVGAAIDKANEQ